MKNCKYDELQWAEAMLKTDGYQRLMEVASEMREYKYESSMEITDNTRAVAGVAISFCYAAMYDDKRRNALLEKVSIKSLVSSISLSFPKLKYFFEKNHFFYFFEINGDQADKAHVGNLKFKA